MIEREEKFFFCDDVLYDTQIVSCCSVVRVVVSHTTNNNQECDGFCLTHHTKGSRKKRSKMDGGWMKGEGGRAGNTNFHTSFLFYLLSLSLSYYRHSMPLRGPRQTKIIDSFNR